MKKYCLAVIVLAALILSLYLLAPRSASGPTITVVTYGGGAGHDSQKKFYGNLY